MFCPLMKKRDFLEMYLLVVQPFILRRVFWQSNSKMFSQNRTILILYLRRLRFVKHVIPHMFLLIDLFLFLNKTKVLKKSRKYLPVISKSFKIIRF